MVKLESIRREIMIPEEFFQGALIAYVDVIRLHDKEDAGSRGKVRLWWTVCKMRS